MSKLPSVIVQSSRRSFLTWCNECRESNCYGSSSIGFAAPNLLGRSHFTQLPSPKSVELLCKYSEVTGQEFARPIVTGYGILSRVRRRQYHIRLGPPLREFYER